MKRPKVLDTSTKKDNLARRHLNQLSGESARGTKVIEKKKAALLKKGAVLPRMKKAY